MRTIKVNKAGLHNQVCFFHCFGHASFEDPYTDKLTEGTRLIQTTFAIVEDPSGEVHQVSPEAIEFLKPPPADQVD